MSYSPTNIKRIQRGNAAVNNGNTSGTSTLGNAVVVARTELRYLGTHSGSIAIALTDTTTVTATRGGSSGDDLVEYEVTEYLVTQF